MFDIFSIVIFIIIIYFIIQKNNSQEKFDDMPPLPGGYWTQSCDKDSASWTQDATGKCTLTASCKNNNYQIRKITKTLSNCNSNLNFNKRTSTLFIS